MGDLLRLIVEAIAHPLVLVVVALAGVGLTLLRRERYRAPGERAPEWTLPTTEVLVDPETGRRQRVHVNPATGARLYVDEPPPGPEHLPPLERPGLLLPPQRPPGLHSGGPPPALPPPPDASEAPPPPS